MLTPDLIKNFEKLGFIKCPFPLFSKEEFHKLSQIVLNVSDKYMDGRSGIKHSAWLADPNLIEFACNENVIGFLKNFLGPNIAVFSSCIYKKNAHTEQEIPWHTDTSNYPELLKDVKALALTIAVTDSTTTSGCVEYAVGSHLKKGRSHTSENPPKNSLFGDRLHFELSNEEVKSLKDTQLVELKASEASICDIDTAHRSAPNRSENDRVTLVFRYMSTSRVENFPQPSQDFWKSQKFIFLISGEDQLNVCNHNIAK